MTRLSSVEIGHESPRANHRLIVDVEKRLDIGTKSFLIERPNVDLEPLAGCIGNEGELLVERSEHIDVAPEGVHVLRLPQAVVLQQATVVGPIVGHHEEGRRIEPLDQQAALVVHRRIEGPAHDIEAALANPLIGRVEQAVGHLLVVDRFEEAEETARIVIPVIVGLVDNRRDAAARPIVTQRQERLDVGGADRTGGPWAGRTSWSDSRPTQPGDSAAVAPSSDPRVELPGQVEELLPLAAGGYRLDDQVTGHGDATSGARIARLPPRRPHRLAAAQNNLPDCLAEIVGNTRFHRSLAIVFCDAAPYCSVPGCDGSRRGYADTGWRGFG